MTLDNTTTNEQGNETMDSRFSELTTAELDTLACKTAKKIESLRYLTLTADGREKHTENANSARQQIAHHTRRLVAMDKELDRRHNGTV